MIFFFFRIGQNQYFLCWEVSWSSEKLLNIKWWIGTKYKSWKKQKRSAIQRFWIWWSPWPKIARSEIRLFRILPKSGLVTKLPKFELYRFSKNPQKTWQKFVDRFWGQMAKWDCGQCYVLHNKRSVHVLLSNFDIDFVLILSKSKI